MEKRPENVFDEGRMLIINKPLNWTSFDVVKKIRNQVRTRKVGHAGTLDPLATGLLILCTGKFTKRINEYMAQEKEYTGDFTLGATTPTYDLESNPQDHKDFTAVTAEQLAQIIPRFTGDFLQVPPMHSAIKKDGRRLYELARKGEDVQPEPRKVFIKEFQITGIELPVVHFRVVCSTGTYIRSLAKDVGDALGCGAYLSSLCRTRIGVFTLDQAVSMEEAEAYIKAELTAIK